MNTEKNSLFDGKITEENKNPHECNSKVKKEEMDAEYSGRYVFKGDVFFADLNPVVGCETGGIRPVVVIQNDIGNRYSPTIIAAITSQTSKKMIPTHVKVNVATGGLTKDSVIMLEQMRTIDKTRLKKLIGHLDDKTLAEVEEAIKTSLGINN